MNLQHDFVYKILCALCTVLLGIAVNSLQDMNSEIKRLSENVFELSAQSKVLIVTLDNIERRVTKIEHENEILKQKAARIERQ